jgi:hypothetical protein
MGLILVGCGAMLLVMAIQAHVWEGEFIRIGDIAEIYLAIYFGLVILGIVVQDYRLVHFGTSGKSFPQLTAEQLEPIRRTLEEDYDVPGAIRLYRDAAPEAGLAEAKRYVIRLFLTLRAEHPEKFVLPPFSPVALNWRVMLRLALIEAVVVGVLWCAMPPSDPASAVYQFAFSFLFGMGVTVGLRVNASWKSLWRRRMLLPAWVLVIVGWTIALMLAQSPWPHLCGLFCGAILMLSGFRSLRALRRIEARQTTEKP